jgi:hypothetical protein
MQEKFEDFISECAENWVGYGFLEAKKGGLRKLEEFEKEWTLRRSQWEGKHGIELDLPHGTKRNMASPLVVLTTWHTKVLTTARMTPMQKPLICQLLI